jgi:hypothetical protein
VLKHVTQLLTGLIGFTFINQFSALADDSVIKQGFSHADFLDLLFYDPTDISIRYTSKPYSRVDGQSENSELRKLEFSADYGFPVSQDTIFFLDTTYNEDSFEFGSTLPKENRFISSTVESFELGTGVATFLNPDLVVAGLFYPSIRSDLDAALNSDDLQFTTGPLVAYRLSHNFEIHGGALALLRHQDTILYPILGVDYMSTDKQYRVNITAPFSARFGYKPNERFELFTSLLYTDEDFRAQVGNVAPINSQIRIRDLQLGAGVVAPLSKSIFLSLEGGVAFGTGYQIRTKSGDKFSGNFDPTPYFALQLGYSFE